MPESPLRLKKRAVGKIAQKVQNLLRRCETVKGENDEFTGIHGVSRDRHEKQL
jgi:hypothetical protein